jgi:hypothetical protein
LSKKKTYFIDGLENLKTGLGTSKDSKTFTEFGEIELTSEEIEKAYRFDWIFPKAVDIPAKDMTRKWLDLNKSFSQEYKKLGVKKIVREALQLKTLYGISYIVIESEKRLLKAPLRKNETVRKLHVYHKYNFDDEIFHPSRVYEMKQNGFGDSILFKIQESILNLLTSLEIPASILHKADQDFLSIKGLADAMRKCKKNENCKDVEEKIITRVQTMYEQLSLYKIGIKDTEEQYENHNKNMSGYDKLQTIYMYIVAGAADIPTTRFFGISPSGMNATGEQEMNMYHESLSSMQDELIEPFLEKINDVMGFEEPIEFLPIRDKTKKDELEEKKLQAEEEKTKAETIALFIDELDPETIAQAVSTLSVFKNIKVISNVE